MALETPLKITQIMLSEGFGGGERLFVDMCLSLSELGHSVQAICHPDFEGAHLLKSDNINIFLMDI